MPTRNVREEKECKIWIQPFRSCNLSDNKTNKNLQFRTEQNLDTPEPNNQTVDTLNSELRDPTYAPATKPRSRRAVQPTREESPSPDYEPELRHKTT